MRTPGAKNKPKFANISLADLNKYLKEHATIPVEINFARIFNHSVPEVIDNPPEKEQTNQESIQFTITKL